MTRNLTVLFCLMVLSGLFSLTGFGQRAASFKLVDHEDINDVTRTLYITVDGQKRLISEKALEAWLLNGGQEVAFTIRGKGWDGEELRLYEVATGKDRQLFSKYDLLISELKEKRLSTGARALLVELAADGDYGDGSLQLAVIDPKRGLVLFDRSVKLTAINGDSIKLSFYRDRDWLQYQTRRLRKTAKPYKIKTLDLKKVLKNKVIVDEE